MLARKSSLTIPPRNIISFGLGSGYRYEHITQIKRVYFEKNVNALNMSFRRATRDQSTLIITLIGDNDERCDVLKISDYFMQDGTKHNKAPKFFFHNGIPINLHCKAPDQQNRKELAPV
ncbi:MAG: hypothetical protein K0U39_01710 [Alphaproteobacteria bacterium]|nr:hypothetical protein [Alphaproteobacteria bacterium]